MIFFPSLRYLQTCTSLTYLLNLVLDTKIVPINKYLLIQKKNLVKFKFLSNPPFRTVSDMRFFSYILQICGLFAGKRYFLFSTVGTITTATAALFSCQFQPAPPGGAGQFSPKPHSPVAWWVHRYLLKLRGRERGCSDCCTNCLCEKLGNFRQGIGVQINW